MKAYQQFTHERGHLGTAFGMSGPTIGIKKDEGKGDEKVQIISKDGNNKILAGMAGKKIWKNVNSAIHTAIKAADGPQVGTKQTRF